MTEDNVCGDDVIKSPAPNKSKVSKETWLRIQADFESGNYKTEEELSQRYGVDRSTLSMRASRQGWYERQRTLSGKVLLKVAEVKETEVQTYLKKAFKRSERLEQLIDSSIAQQPTDANGNPLVDTDQIDQITRSELRIHELAKSALRIVDTKGLDVTSGGLSIAENFTEAVKKLREVAANEKLPELTDEEIEKLKDCKIEGEEGV